MESAIMHSRWQTFFIILASVEPTFESVGAQNNRKTPVNEQTAKTQSHQS